MFSNLGRRPVAPQGRASNKLLNPTYVCTLRLVCANMYSDMCLDARAMGHGLDLLLTQPLTSQAMLRLMTHRSMWTYVFPRVPSTDMIVPPWGSISP